MEATIYGQLADVLPPVDPEVRARSQAVTQIIQELSAAVWSYAQLGDAELAGATAIECSERIDGILAQAEAAR